MTTKVYVVSDVAWRDGASIIGVRSTLDGAKSLADADAKECHDTYEDWKQSADLWTWERERVVSVDRISHTSQIISVWEVP